MENRRKFLEKTIKGGVGLVVVNSFLSDCGVKRERPVSPETEKKKHLLQIDITNAFPVDEAEMNEDERKKFEGQLMEFFENSIKDGKVKEFVARFDNEAYFPRDAMTNREKEEYIASVVKQYQNATVPNDDNRRGAQVDQNGNIRFEFWLNSIKGNIAKKYKAEKKKFIEWEKEHHRLHQINYKAPIKDLREGNMNDAYYKVEKERYLKNIRKNWNSKNKN